MISLFSTLLLLAAPDAERGLAIAIAADKAESGFGAERTIADMTIQTGTGDVETRTFRLTLLDSDPERSLVELLEPARHRGMKVLTLAEKAGEDQVFVYFPKHGRNQRIVGRKRTGRFLGSDLTFEDLGSRKHYRYDHRYLRDESVGGLSCHVVESIPKDADTGYSRIELWREVGTYRLLKVAWYDRAGGALLKTGVFSEWTKVDGFARPGRYEIVSAETGRKTALVFRDRAVKNGLPDGVFSPESLDR